MKSTPSKIDYKSLFFKKKNKNLFSGLIYHIKSQLLVFEPTDLQKREFRILNSWQCSSPQNLAIIIKERKHLLPEMFHVLELTIGIYFVIF